METHLKNEIMLQSRHLFIYGYNGKNRETFLRSLEEDYPIVSNKDAPMAIYLDNYALPMVDGSYDKNDFRISSIAREYLNFTIISSIIRKMIIDLEADDIKEQAILRAINRIVDTKTSKFRSLKELLTSLIKSQDFYREYYIRIMSKDNSYMDMEKLKIQFLELNMILEYIKEALGNSSYFGIIVDRQKEIPIVSTKAINDIISMRINGDLSMKVACEPDKWEDYTGLTGTRIDYIHDYGSVELDESNKEYTLELRKKYFKE